MIPEGSDGNKSCKSRGGNVPRLLKVHLREYLGTICICFEFLRYHYIVESANSAQQPASKSSAHITTAA